MTTRRIHSQDAAGAAEVVRQCRERPIDLIDPFPPATEMEILVDMGARGDEAHARVALDGKTVVGFGAVDFSPHMRRAQLVGPVVQPAQRRRGHGLQLLNDLLDQARAAKQRYVRVSVGSENGAAQALLKSAGFRPKDRYMCLRMHRPHQYPEFELEGVTVRRALADDGDVYFNFTGRIVPRQPKQTRSLLKTDNYIALLAVRRDKPVGCVEVDMRYGGVATVENLDGPPSLLHKGLGNMLLIEAMRVAFENDTIDALDFLMPAGDRERVKGLEQLGFTVLHELVAYEVRL